MSSMTLNSMTLNLTDSATMVRRSLKRIVRYPSMTLILIALPIVFLLLFVYVFGATLGDGLGGASGGRGAYVNFVTPGIILLAVTSGAQGTAISVAMDLTSGIIARFRTMPIARTAVLTGHVLGSLLQTVFCVTVVMLVAIGIGFRPTASAVEWLAVFGVLVMITFALTWLSVALGLVSDSVETASNTPMVLTFLPFLGSGFVPTDSMPTALRWFADYQPFTPIMDTLRGLLLDGPIGNSAWLSVGWCAVIALLSYLWAKRLFNRRVTV